ncbi:MAG TPA: hypothetical protein VM715_22950 [Candidatus Acidoferrum sp.]|nr:hypothetical protein [Candidatus Acidoferrum sp.]
MVPIQGGFIPGAPQCRILTKTKIFDPADRFAPLADPGNLTDCTVAKRNRQWWMYLAGTVIGRPGIHLFSASRPQARHWLQPAGA